MKTAYGLQVDAWGALVVGKAALADELEPQVIRGVKERALPRLKVTKAPVSLDGTAQEHLIFQQEQARGGQATMALRMTKQGKEDLVLSWRLFERNVRRDMFWALAQGLLAFWGLIFALSGLLMVVFGIGMCLLPVGLSMMVAAFVWWKLAQKRTTASTYQQFDSRLLALTVDYALMKALASKGVAAQELRVLQQANIAGLGNLENTSLIMSLA